MEAKMLLWIQNHVRNDMLTPVMKGITFLGNGGWFFLLVLVLLLFFKETRKAGAVGLFAEGISAILNNLILKNAVGRVRPYEVIDGLELLVHKAWDLSFPSGHSAASFSAATVLFLLLPKKYGIPALLLAALIAFSRLYVGIHYPSDVLAGTVDGILIGVFSVYMANRRKIKWLEH